MFNLRRSLKHQAAHLTPWHVVVSLLFITQLPSDSHWSEMGLMLCGRECVLCVCGHAHTLPWFNGARLCLIMYLYMLLYARMLV